MNNHIEISVNINPVWSEYLSDILINQVGCSGVVTEETEYKDEKVTSSTKAVKGYLWFNEDNPPDIEKIKDIILKNKDELVESGVDLQNLGSWELSTKFIAEEEWAHNWKKYWHPQKIGSKIVICPSWEEYKAQKNEIIIELDPGTAFGTGAHPTTRLCIIALEKYIQENDQLADVGTGSGILAIAGLKLGAKHAIGVDNDLSVINVAKENANKNHVLNKCSFYEGSAKDIEGCYEIVTANILAHVLIEMMQDLSKLTKANGKLILSGIISEKANDVSQSAINSGFKILETLTEEDWVVIIAEKI